MVVNYLNSPGLRNPERMYSMALHNSDEVKELAERDPEIRILKDSLASSAQSLSEEINELAIRLETVLFPDPPPSEEETSISYGTELGKHLYKTLTVLDSSISLVRSITSRVEV